MYRWVYIFKFLKSVMHGLLYSLLYFSSYTYICTFSALIGTNCFIRVRYNSKSCYFTSVHTKWNIWSSFHQTVIKLRYSAFLRGYVKGMRRWTIIRVQFQITVACCVFVPFSQLHVVNAYVMDNRQIGLNNLNDTIRNFKTLNIKN
jgi:hypothetical protein